MGEPSRSPEPPSLSKRPVQRSGDIFERSGAPACSSYQLFLRYGTPRKTLSTSIGSAFGFVCFATAIARASS